MSVEIGLRQQENLTTHKGTKENEIRTPPKLTFFSPRSGIRVSLENDSPVFGA
jgi:hypothetical protein